MSLSSLLEPDSIQLALLAILQGLTEFLPVSSSGHLVLAQATLGERFTMDALGVDVALHLGTLVSVAVVYRRALARILADLLSGHLRETLQIVVASIPAATLGLFFLESFEGAFHDPRKAALGLLATAAILLLGEQARRRQIRRGAADGGEPEEAPLTWKQAILIGLAQGLAVWPGVSRSGATIAMGLLCGLPAARAARFSFLLSVPAIAGASLLHLPDALAGGAPGAGAARLAAAMLLAALVGYGALRALLSFLGKGAFSWFAIYCAVLGGATLLL